MVLELLMIRDIDEVFCVGALCSSWGALAKAVLHLLKYIIPCSATFDPEAFIEQGALDVLNAVVHLGTVGQSAGSAWIL